MLKSSFRELQRRLLRQVKLFYGKRLVSFVVFGSAARETQRYDSDLDFLMVVKDLPRGRMRRVREFDKIENRLEPLIKKLHKKGIDTYFSPIIKSPEEVEFGSPLFLDMVYDAKILLDRDRFFFKRLERLRARLKELGSRRIWSGNAWYWELKPDYKPGEVFEI
ncbi:MAG: nucleotidyltransferase domain-containing protein [Chlamydiae bacterium]|nr:nucleotidyltransferase domain-containing protein [Chlamydiota bacterium]MBI3277344.1 nucleotidyltransferase domain-containing protein [Chlamydiota bacterium]